MYLVASSPLTKVFLPEWCDRLIKEPNLITDTKTSFTFNIPFGTGAIGPFTYGRVTRLDDLPCVRRRDPKDTPALYQLLTGGEEGMEYRETEPYGLAAVTMSKDITSLYMEVADMKIRARTNNDEAAMLEAKAYEEKVMEEIDAQTAKAHATALEMSHKRVMRMVKDTYERITKQWALSKERNEGQHKAASPELCCIYVLKSVIENESKETRVMNEEVARLVNYIQTTV